MTSSLFSHPLLKAFHVHNHLYVVTKDSIYRSSGFPSPNGFGKWKFVAANPQTFTADMAFCLVPLPPSSFLDGRESVIGGAGVRPSTSGLFGTAARPSTSAGHQGGPGPSARQGRNGDDRRRDGGPDPVWQPDVNEDVLINWQILEGN